MHVVIPVAGLGTRLRPHTWSKPKPLVTVAGKPILGHVLDRLLSLPLERVVFVTGYLGEQIEDYVRSHYRFEALFVEQPEPLGQSHALLQAKGLIDGPTLVVFPDLIFDADLESLVTCTWDGVVFVKEVDDPRRFGVVIVEDGRIVRLVEKPQTLVSHLAVVGVYYFRDFADLIDAIEQQIAEDRRRGNEYYLAEAIQILIDRGRTIVAQPVSVWEDCGTVEALLQTNRFLLERQSQEHPTFPNSVVIPPVVIDPSATIERAVVGPYVSIGASAVVSRAIVTDSIIDEGATIDGVMLHRSIVGRRARVAGDFLRVNVGDSSEIAFARQDEG
ncbi:sugar phosphate nucleotidyltransferase [Thermomicrobium sp. 4228-Ro]|uniref:sugar phosphate nucleotidyltransferase n=1 Tax=Thermomicrobium sp. 4228-Ro TaxID=2993937 RepID=UPI0022495F6B|nr:sugar phosphate nucleotidyltransferase [Thermomicrobium sp. 4228-Ro]MCX2726512.1 sugar phosphate nucleotidyltransferase [Thermomicrobium sp. 4228-Ro]